MNPKLYYQITKIRELVNPAVKQNVMVVCETSQKAKDIFDAFNKDCQSDPVDYRNLKIRVGQCSVQFHNKHDLNCFTYQNVYVDEWPGMTDDDWFRILCRVRPSV